ncbi:hypothetical protein PS2_036302 [Malus domestica]
MEVTEPPASNNEDENDDVFFDALDDFPSDDESDQSTSPPTLSLPDSKPPQATHLRRRSFVRAFTGDDSNTSTLEESSLGSSRIDPTNDARLSFRARRFKLPRSLRESESTPDRGSSAQVPSDQNNEGSTVTTAANDGPSADSANSAAQIGDPSFNLLVFIAELVIKAIGL